MSVGIGLLTLGDLSGSARSSESRTLEFLLEPITSVNRTSESQPRSSIERSLFLFPTRETAELLARFSANALFDCFPILSSFPFYGCDEHRDFGDLQGRGDHTRHPKKRLILAEGHFLPNWTTNPTRAQHLTQAMCRSPCH